MFPVTDSPGGVVAFGGHDQWRRGMGERFPTVRFVPVNYRYDASVIRNASSVWVHAGYISHAMYNQIVRDAKLNGKDIHYFSGLSIPSSARLMADVLRPRQ